MTRNSDQLFRSIWLMKARLLCTAPLSCSPPPSAVPAQRLDLRVYQIYMDFE